MGMTVLGLVIGVVAGALPGITMLNAIVDASLRYKVLVLVGFAVLLGLGVQAFRNVPVDAFPDVTPIQVNIYTESPGLAAEDDAARGDPTDQALLDGEGAHAREHVAAVGAGVDGGRGHRQLREHTPIPVAVGESMYHPMQFREYLEQGACSIVQPDVARIGGITPWLKTAHLAETFDVAVCPHFLMELHVSLCAAVPNASWVEYIPQLDDITTSRMQVQDGYALPPSSPGLGIDWDWAAIAKRQKVFLEIETP